MEPSTTAQHPLLQGTRPSWFRAWEAVQTAILAASIFSVILPILAVAYLLVQKGLPAMTWGFITKPPEQFMKAGGIMPAIVGTLYLLAGTYVFALPLGLFGAVYITEYGQRGPLTRALRLAIVNLAGVPSVVYGLFGLGF